MTRFARAKGSKACNKKLAEDGTPWRMLKSGMKCLNEKEENCKDPSLHKVDVSSPDKNLPSQSPGESNSRNVIDKLPLSVFKSKKHSVKKSNDQEGSTETFSSQNSLNNVHPLEEQLTDKKFPGNKFKNKLLKKGKEINKIRKNETEKRIKGKSLGFTSHDIEESPANNSLPSQSIRSGKSNPRNNIDEPLSLFKSKKHSVKKSLVQEDNKDIPSPVKGSDNANSLRLKVTDPNMFSLDNSKPELLQESKSLKKRGKKTECYQCKSSLHVFENCPQIKKDWNFYSSTEHINKVGKGNTGVLNKFGNTKSHDVHNLTSKLVKSLFKSKEHGVKRSRTQEDNSTEPPSPNKVSIYVKPLKQCLTEEKFSAKKLKKQLKEGKCSDKIDLITNETKKIKKRTFADSASQEVDDPSDITLSTQSVRLVKSNSWSEMEDMSLSLFKSKKNSVRRSHDLEDDEEATSNRKCLTFLNPSGLRLTDSDKFALNKMKNKLLSEGKDLEVIDKIMEKETREISKKLKTKKLKCFICQARGHTVKDCPENETSEICFICGSTEHKFRACRQKKNTHDKFAFAKCFICKEQGHISTVCPDNPSGLYPYGGGCHTCGEVTHFSRDCPQQQKANTKKSLTLPTLSDDVEGLPEDKPLEKIRGKKKNVKIVKF